MSSNDKFDPQYFNDLKIDGYDQLNLGNPAQAEKVARDMVDYATIIPNEPFRNFTTKEGLWLLTQAQLDQNNHTAAQETVRELTQLAQKTGADGSPLYEHDMGVAAILLAYTQLKQSNADNVIIAAEQAIQHAESIEKPKDKDILKGSALTVLAYGYMHKEDPEKMLEIVKEKIALIGSEVKPGDKNRTLSMIAALGIKASAYLMQGEIGKARTINEFILAKLDKDSMPSKLFPAYADIAEGKTEETYQFALRTMNEVISKGKFDPDVMYLLRYAAYAQGKNKDYANYVYKAKDDGFIRRDDPSFDPIGVKLNPEQEREETIGRWTRSAVFTTDKIIRAINADAAEITGINKDGSAKSDDERRGRSSR